MPLFTSAGLDLGLGLKNLVLFTSLDDDDDDDDDDVTVFVHHSRVEHSWRSAGAVRLRQGPACLELGEILDCSLLRPTASGTSLGRRVRSSILYTLFSVTRATPISLWQYNCTTVVSTVERVCPKILTLRPILPKSIQTQSCCEHANTQRHTGM